MMNCLFGNMLSKLLLALGLSVLILGCSTLDERVDPLVGVWDYEIFNLPRGEPLGYFTLSKIDDQYNLVLSNAKGLLEVEDVSIEKERIVGGQFVSEGYTIDLRGVFDGNTFEGNIDAEGNVFRMEALKRE